MDREKTIRLLEAFDSITKTFTDVESIPEGINLGKPELLVLDTVYKEEGLMMSGLSKRLGIRLSTATGIVDRLIEKELVDRQRDYSDRRMVRVVLTEKGRKTSQMYQRRKRESFKRMANLLTEAEQESLGLIFEKIAGELKKRKGDKSSGSKMGKHSKT